MFRGALLCLLCACSTGVDKDESEPWPATDPDLDTDTTTLESDPFDPDTDTVDTDTSAPTHTSPPADSSPTDTAPLTDTSPPADSNPTDSGDASPTADTTPPTDTSPPTDTNPTDSGDSSPTADTAPPTDSPPADSDSGDSSPTADTAPPMDTLPDSADTYDTSIPTCPNPAQRSFINTGLPLSAGVTVRCSGTPAIQTESLRRHGTLLPGELQGVLSSYAAGNDVQVHVHAVAREILYVGFSPASRSVADLRHNVVLPLPATGSPPDHAGWISSCDPAAIPGSAADCDPTVPPLSQGTYIQTIVTDTNGVQYNRWHKDFSAAPVPLPVVTQSGSAETTTYLYDHDVWLPEAFFVPPGLAPADVSEVEVWIGFGDHTVFAVCTNGRTAASNTASFTFNPNFETYVRWCPSP